MYYYYNKLVTKLPSVLPSSISPTGMVLSYGTDEFLSMKPFKSLNKFIVENVFWIILHPFHMIIFFYQGVNICEFKTRCATAHVNRLLNDKKSVPEDLKILGNIKNLVKNL